MTAQEIKDTKKYQKIRESLLDQLERTGNLTAHFADLVEDYMKMYIVKELANADVQEHGITIEYRNSETQYGRKKNDAVEQILKTNQQMIKLLEMLGIKPDPKASAEDEEL